MSIRYKFILSLLALTTFCLGLYIWIAKSVFEKDKEVAIFESTGQTSQARAHSIKKQIEESLKLSRSIISTYNPETRDFSPTGKELFEQRADLVLVALLQGDQFQIFRSKLVDITADSALSDLGPQKALVTPSSKKGVIFVAMPLQNAEKEQHLVIATDLHEQQAPLTFNAQEGGSFLALSHRPLFTQDDFPTSLAEGLLEHLPVQVNLTEQTAIHKVEGRDYLISSEDALMGGLRIMTAIPKTKAFESLGILYRKSLQFFTLIVFVVLFVSVIMTRRMLRNLDTLTIATSEISKGHFDVNVGVQSKDEFGLLASSFKRMSQEIKRLLFETKEKARMESELKTAQTVQETMFPLQNYVSPKIEVAGNYRSASECGGDWWYYFEHATGLYILICDATGHGAPAALITAAAKSAVNIMKNEAELSLEKLVKVLNYALFETARGQILMTGYILHIDPQGQVRYINASHECPFTFVDGEIKYFMDPVSPHLGKSLQSEFLLGSLPSYKELFYYMYTDGITTQHDKEGREFGERRLLRFLSKADLSKISLDGLNQEVFKMVDEFRKDYMQEDDLTSICLRLKSVQN